MTASVHSPRKRCFTATMTFPANSTKTGTTAIRYPRRAKNESINRTMEMN